MYIDKYNSAIKVNNNPIGIDLEKGMWNITDRFRRTVGMIGNVNQGVKEILPEILFTQNLASGVKGVNDLFKQVKIVKLDNSKDINSLNYEYYPFKFSDTMGESMLFQVKMKLLINNLLVFFAELHLLDNVSEKNLLELN